MGLAKLKGLDPMAVQRQREQQNRAPRGFPNPQRSKTSNGNLPRSRKAEKIKPKPKAKRVRPEDNPNFIFCFRCQKHHHKDEHALGLDPSIAKQEKEKLLRQMRVSSSPPNPARRVSNNSYDPMESTNSGRGRPQQRRQRSVRPPPPRRKKERSRSRYEEEEEDEYSDDFIDDTDLNGRQRAYVNRAYGYDDQYSDEDDDLRGMDAGFDDIAYEEEISGRIAKQEDQFEERINRKYGGGVY